MSAQEKILRELLEEAAQRFREYETHHRAKPDPVKADRNGEIARRIEDALSAPTAEPTPEGTTVIHALAMAKTLAQGVLGAMMVGRHLKQLAHDVIEHADNAKVVVKQMERMR